MRRSLMRMFRWPGTWVLGATLIWLFSCGDPPSETERFESAFSVASCATAPSDAFGFPNPDFSVTSPAGYNTCYKSYVVTVGTGGSGGATPCGVNKPPCAGTGGTHNLYVEYAGTIPTTQTSCSNLTGGAIFYRYDPATLSYVQVGNTQSASGLWLFGQCHPPAFNLPSYEQYEIYPQPASLRVAATMRDAAQNTLPLRVFSQQYYFSEPH